jgi:sortase (surface protein transpeptidase)
MLDASLLLKTSPTQQWLLEMSVYYAVVAQKLAHNQPLRVLRRTGSHALTALLLFTSVAGFAQLIHLTVESAPSSLLATTASKESLQTAGHHSGTSTATTPPSPKQPAGLPASTPTRLQVPAINLDANLVSVGLNADGALDVPPRDTAGWYTGSPTPGEIGPSVIDGHVDSVYGIAVFWFLKNLKPGDTISVTREDGRTVNFSVQKIASYDQSNFPTNDVYGDINYAGLRLITCDGDFNYATRHYSNNLVVYARATR